MKIIEHEWLKYKEWLEDFPEDKLCVGFPWLLKEGAPEKAQISYAKYLEQLNRIDKNTDRWLLIPKTQKGAKIIEDDSFVYETHETEDYIVFKIPYKEIHTIREALGKRYGRTYRSIADYFFKSKIDEVILMLDEVGAVETLKVIKRAKSYGFDFDFVEAEMF